MTLAAYAGLSILNYVTAGTGVLHALAYAALLLAVHFACVVAITALYRISPLHPLYSFPGPLLSKITSIKEAQLVLTGKRHFILVDLHQKYGPFVRIGAFASSGRNAMADGTVAPNSISINSVEAVGPIYSAANAFEKSTLYRLGRIMSHALLFIRERGPHAERRKIWAGAFTPSASVFLQTYIIHNANACSLD